MGEEKQGKCPRCGGMNLASHLEGTRRKGVFGLFQVGCRDCLQVGPKVEVPDDCFVLDPYFAVALKAWEDLCAMESVATATT